MKKAIVITAIVALTIGVGGGVWLKTRLDAQAVAEAAHEQKQEQPKSKYEVGPPDAQEILELVNKERARIGVAPLEVDPMINASAQEKADDMVNRNYRDHVSPEGIHGYELVFKHTGGECRYASENLTWRTDNNSDTSRDAFSSWMNSEPHRKALQDSKYTKTGVGINKDIVVQHFCQP